MLHDAPEHVIEPHDTRAVQMSLGPEDQSAGAQFRVTSVKHRSSAWWTTGFQAGLAWCNMLSGNRSMMLDVVKNSLWVDTEAYTTTAGALNADARFVELVMDGMRSPADCAYASGHPSCDPWVCVW